MLVKIDTFCLPGKVDCEENSAASRENSPGVVVNVFEMACEQYEKAESRLSALRNTTQRNAPEVCLILPFWKFFTPVIALNRSRTTCLLCL